MSKDFTLKLINRVYRVGTKLRQDCVVEFRDHIQRLHDLECSSL